MRVAILTLLSAGLLAAAPGNAAPPPFLPSVTLTVGVAQGAGTVTSAPAGIALRDDVHSAIHLGHNDPAVGDAGSGLDRHGLERPVRRHNRPDLHLRPTANTSVTVSFSRPTLTVPCWT